MSGHSTGEKISIRVQVRSGSRITVVKKPAVIKLNLN